MNTIFPLGLELSFPEYPCAERDVLVWLYYGHRRYNFWFLFLRSLSIRLPFLGYLAKEIRHRIKRSSKIGPTRRQRLRSSSMTPRVPREPSRYWLSCVDANLRAASEGHDDPISREGISVNDLAASIRNPGRGRRSVRCLFCQAASRSRLVTICRVPVGCIDDNRPQGGA